MYDEEGNIIEEQRKWHFVLVYVMPVYALDRRRLAQAHHPLRRVVE